MIDQSSIVNEVVRTISSLSLFFLRKYFECTKTRHKQKPTNKTKTSKHRRTKTTIFTDTKTSKRVKIVCFALWYIFCVQNIFVKKINRLEIVLITSFTMLLMCTPINPPTKNLFFINLDTNVLLHLLDFFVCALIFIFFLSVKTFINVKTSKVLIFFC